jgi:hypothetical protein
MSNFKKNVNNFLTKKAKEIPIYHHQLPNKISLIVSQAFQIC